MNKRFVTVLWSLSLFFALSSALAQAQESAWPHTLALESGSVTIYPLQVDEKDGDLVRFRAALAYRQTDNSDPVFGAGWFESRVQIDREKGVVHPYDLVLSETRFPEGTDEVQQELTAVFAQQSPGWNLDFPLAEFNSALAAAEQEARTEQNLNTAPPTIIYRDHPALLVTFDGEPVLRAIENSHYQAVINTPYPLIFDGRVYHLSAAKGAWYRADRATGPYRFDAGPPADIVTMVDAAAEAEVKSAVTEKVTAANAPEIVVATTPTELIVTDGPAAFVPLVDDLLVLNNAADDVFMHISSQQFYVVLAGRWYQSPSLNGPWTYRAADELPAAFASIPQNSDQADSRVYVAGTQEAKEAVLDAQIPQTAAVARGTVDLDVTYDGDPRFEPVEGTDDLAYADNTGSSVLREDGQYYLVEDGVWYVSSSPYGPWEVSDERPAGLASISPRSPVYNVKYVYIYDSTPEVVYVGYTPGYTGSYVYYDTIVYGTGWYYRPWISPRYYYPRYSTWGYNVSYDPWYGWNFGLSWGWGPFYPGYYSGGYWHHNRPWYSPRYSYWGPGGYRPRPHDRYTYGRGGYDHHGYGRGGDDDERYGHGGHDHGGYVPGGQNRDRYGRDGDDQGENGRYGSGRNGGGQDNPGYGSADTYVRNQNLYRDRAQRARVAETGDTATLRRPREAGRSFATNPNTPAMRQRDLNRGLPGEVRPSKPGRNQTGPVTPSDLRIKAQVRDAQREADRGGAFAASKGNGPRRMQPPQQQGQPRGWQSAAAGDVSGSSAPLRDAGRTSIDRRPGRPVEYIASAQAAQLTPAQRTAGLKQPSASAGRAPSTPPRQNYSRPAQRQQTAQPDEPQGRATRPSARQQGFAPRTDARASTPQVREMQRNTQQRSAPQVITQQRSAPSRIAPPRIAQQRSAPQVITQQRSAPPGNAPQVSAQRPSPPSSDTRQSASPHAAGRERGYQDGGRRNGGRSKQQG